MTHREVQTRVRALGREHHCVLPGPYLELQSRLLKDGNFYRGHPVRVIGWMLRYARPGNVKRRWQEVRTGTFRIAG